MRTTSPEAERRALGARLLAFCLALAAVACGNTQNPTGFTDDGSSDDSGGLASGPCDEGQTRECGITLDQYDGIVSCYRGQQRCEAGVWSTCTDGEISQEVDPSTKPKDNSVKAVSTPTTCVGNPCDPSCQYYNEDPTDITPPGTTIPSNPAIPNWSSTATTAACSHDLCATGTALVASCHPCVQKVCASNPSCCSSSWTSTCTDLVYTTCASTTPPAATGLTMCDFAAFGQSAIRFGNGGTGYPVIGSGSGSAPSGDGSSVYLETNCNVGAIYSTGAVNLRNGCQINGNVTAVGNVWLEAGSTKLTGTLTSGGNVELRNNTIVTGAIQATGTITLQASAQAQSTTWSGGTTFLNSGSKVLGNVTSYGTLDGQATGHIYGSGTVYTTSTIGTNLTIDGGKFYKSTVTKPAAPTVTLPDLNPYRRNLTSSCTIAASRPAINTAADVTLAPGVYGALTMSSGKKLTLQAGGSYVFQSIRFYANSLGFRLAGSPKWDVSVCTTFATDSGINAYLNNTTTKNNPQDLIIYSAATSGDGISIGDTNNIDAMMIAPDSQIHVFNNYTGTAALWGKTVYSEAGAKITNIPATDCKATNVFATSQCDGTTAMYADGKTYATGDKVFSGTTIYTCKVGGWCSLGGGYGGATGYWPGQGSAWTTAWTASGTCPSYSNPSAPAVCPISLTLPATPAPQSTCYSGADCQNNTHCTEVKTSSTCGHSKCVTGTALTSTCDSCVARVCADTASCCSTSWDSTCVAKVATLCDASCGAVTTTGCAHDACAVGTALASSCSTDVAAVCGSSGFASCCTTAWTQSCVDKLFLIKTGSVPSTAPAANASVCDFAVMGNGSGTIYSATVKGSVGWLNGAVAIQNAGTGRPKITGDVYNMGSMAIYQADIGGKVVAKGSYYDQGGSVVSGGVTAPNGTVPAVTTPTYTYTCPTGGADNYNATGTLAPGNYGTIQVQGTLTLQPGNYYMQALQNYGNTIQLPATGNVNIYLCTNLEQGYGAKILSPSNNPLQLYLYTKQGVLNFQGTSVSWGVFATGASGGTITLNQNATIYGAAQAYWGIFQAQAGSVVDGSGYTRAACLSRGVDPSGNTTPTCPVTTPALTSTAVETGTCVDNSTNFQVSTSVCAAADLAVAVDCSANTVPVCNHGNTTVPASQAELIFYPKSGQQYANSTPDSAWEAGRCTVTSAIPAGGCVDQVCSSALVNQDLTVRVALKSTATVTECSTMDNWGYYVNGRSCTSTTTGGNLTRNEIYEAKCPANTSPYWGFFTWNSSTPSTSTIAYDMRTATTSAGLATASYTTVQTAKSTPTDTQVCSLSSCPVNITTTLWGSRGKKNQPSFLELRATLTSAGANAPTLKDWKITYSCVYDQ